MLGQGGRALLVGGGGGGGLFGGGGSGLQPAPSNSPPTGGGGGGGSNLVPGGGTATVSGGGPSVTISYQGEGCWTSAGAGTKCRFLSTGSQDTFVVPAGVSSLHVVATGAPGGVGSYGGSAGRGAQVSGDVTVTRGQTLYVNVGGPGGFGAGGFNGGGNSYDNVISGGGGGGATDLRTVSSTQDSSLASRLIVAAGGGGSGVGDPDVCDDNAITTTGGNGGDAGSDGGQGGPGGPINNHECDLQDGGGGAGTQTAGGHGGYTWGGWPMVDGNGGSLGQGGDGGSGAIGGGGGGGLYGGGGGSSGNGISNGTAGGGGGGSNLVPAGGSAVISSSPPSVLITYQAIGLTPPVAPKLHLAIRGPRGVWPGHTAAYRITLRRTQPHNRRAYPVRNVHVTSTHARHRVGHWLVRTLPRGRSRTLRLKVNVPTTARGSYCITTRAAARHTRSAAVRHCTAVVTAPPQGLG